jgi:hypothetical protein
MRNFGKKSLDEIKERLAARGLIEAPVRDESAEGALSDDGAVSDDAGISDDAGLSDEDGPSDNGEEEPPARQES